MLSGPFTFHPHYDLISWVFHPEAKVCQRIEYYGRGNPHWVHFYYFHISFKKGLSARPQKTNSCWRSRHLHSPWRSAYPLGKDIS